MYSTLTYGLITLAIARAVTGHTRASKSIPITALIVLRSM